MDSFLTQVTSNQRSTGFTKTERSSGPATVIPTSQSTSCSGCGTRDRMMSRRKSPRPLPQDQHRARWPPAGIRAQRGSSLKTLAVPLEGVTEFGFIIHYALYGESDATRHGPRSKQSVAGWACCAKGS